jgi:hypothetical protein
MLDLKSFLATSFNILKYNLIFNVFPPINHIFDLLYLHKALFVSGEDRQLQILKRYFNVAKTMFSCLPIVAGRYLEELVYVDLCSLQDLR